MNAETIEKELAEVKDRLAKLDVRVGSSPVPRRDWRKAIGFAKDSELFDEAMRFGAEWRAKANTENL